ncbi:primosomal protein N' [Salirhabdus salicampi]|uniref:primosomal protein N' n=1 Tax=Salirhabdus salicampi TaxID=476102 RepID=UPI0020C4BF93|nr:primosomal protein N' [Salirhabdus salicampi]
MNIARVVVDVPSMSTDQVFDYRIPDSYLSVVEKGMRVIVPFGPRKVMGFVVDITAESSFHRLREIEDVMDFTPILTEELLSLGKWLADTTLSFYLSALQVMLPQVLKAKYKKEIWKLTEDHHLSETIQTLFAGRDVINFQEVEDRNIPYTQIQKEVKKGLIEVRYAVKSKETKKKVLWVKPMKDPHLLQEYADELSKNAAKQKQIIEYFLENNSPIPLTQLRNKLGITRSPIDTLQKKQLVSVFEQEMYRDPYEHRAFKQSYPLPLTEQQRQAMEPIEKALISEQHDVFLLHGVTGSGKTEVYLQSIQKVLAKGQEAIVLVPEIALTPQMVERFKSRFGSKVAVLHSALSAGEKYDEWRKIQRNEVSVVVGARSAIFAPFKNLGIIIIDEEHETSYKQEDHPRYHARDVAIFRGEKHRCPVVLGSATPTLETFARARKGVYQLLTLSKRMNDQSMPAVEIIDMREELHNGNRSMFSQALQQKIVERMNRNEQMVLFLNRRGYSTFVICRDCGETIQCPHCDISLTYHKRQNRLKCHYCAYEQPMPNACPKCESPSIRYFGTGTQKVEEELNKTFPEAKVIRMDVDTTSRKGSHERLLKKFGQGEADILLGTQMIAKGLDFENVTLVGVLAADSMLHLPDFRASEKTFQLLTQVSGRAGRHHLPGEVMVQTYTPEHYSVILASQYDFEGFYQKEMHIRKTFQYPPYYFLTLVHVSHENHVFVVDVIQRITKVLSTELQRETKILGPTPSPLSRIKNRYRYQCMVKYRNEPNIHVIMKKILQMYEEDIQKNELQITIDFQPYQMM